MSGRYDAIQEEDWTDTATAAKNVVREKVEKRLQRESLEVEAHVRSLIKSAEEALAGDVEERPERLLSELHWYLWLDPGRKKVIRTRELPNDVIRLFRRMHSFRERGRRPPAEKEYQVLSEVAKELGYIAGVGDKTPKAPITLEHLSGTGAKSLVEEDEVLPIGRKKMKTDSSTSIDYMSRAIPHESCDHILTVASPRQGKDSTNARICGNLKDQHGYKWVSLFDDGRNELPMIAIPNDEKPIRRSLEKLGQEPKAYRCKVYVPAMPGLPDRLPANHVPFTIGVDDLTPELILRLTGKTSPASNTERRVREALRTAKRTGGNIERLVSELHEMANEMEATVTVTNEDVDEQIQEMSYKMEEDAALQQAANTVAQYAADGLIADAGTDTNLDMTEILKDQESVAALNCNFLEDGFESLRYIIMDVWMQMIWNAADESKTVPRIAMEIREIKNSTHSQPQKLKYTSHIQATKETIMEIASQGGSRGMMMVGSTQKVNAVEREVRVNMRNKIVLSNEDEGISTLKESLDLDGLEETIKDFDKGQGLIATPKWRRWPVRFAGARCGLGDKDRNWLDRYGIAWGARVREDQRDNWRNRHEDVDWWVEVNDVEVHTGDERPAIRDYYSDWYLLDRDFPAGVEPDDVDQELVDEVLQERREYPIRSDLSLKDVSELKSTRETSYQDLEKAQEERTEEFLEEHDVPSSLEAWTNVSEEKRERLLDALKVVRDKSCASYKDIAAYALASKTAIGNYAGTDGELETCMVKGPESDAYELTPIGEKALAVPWSQLPE